MGELRVGERLRLLDGSFATVTRVQVEHAPCVDPAWRPGMPATGTLGTGADARTGTFTTYNFEVATWHTYFAAPVGSSSTRQAIWVHNLNVGECIPGGKDFAQALHRTGLSRAEKRTLLEQFKANATSGRSNLSGLSRNNRSIAEYLDGLGRKVFKNPLEGARGAGRQGDAFVDGVLHEFKTLSPNPTPATIKNAVNNSIRKGGQARNIVIDARGTGLGRANAEQGIFKALGVSRGKVDRIVVIGDDFFVGYGPK